jgi:threonine synthase
VTEAEIREAVRALGRAGFCVEPTSAVVLPALDRLTAAGRIQPGERVVLVLSGFGLKAGAVLQDLAG